LFETHANVLSSTDCRSQKNIQRPQTYAADLQGFSAAAAAAAVVEFGGAGD